MAKHQDIVGHYASLYNRIGLWIIAGLTLLGFLAEQIAFKYGFTYSIVFSAVYFLLVTMINGRCWRKAAQKAGNGLTRFYFASSAARMLLAFIVVLVGAFFLRGDKTCLLSFALIFATYYVLMQVFDCIFFSHIEKKHLIK